MVHPNLIQTDENDPTRISFGCPVTITVAFVPSDMFQRNAHLIGLAIRAKMQLFMPRNEYKLDVKLLNGSHINQFAIERQINDKERVTAAFEKDQIWQTILKLIT